MQRMGKSNSTGCIFFVHRGPLQPYVRAAILQARASDPEAEIVVLTDQVLHSVAKEITEVARFFHIDEFSSRANSLQTVFQADGPNEYSYELMNFQRWFFVEEFLKTSRVRQSFLLLDSDAYLYLPIRNVSLEVGTPMTVVDEVGPQFTFFQNLDALTKFTNFLMSIFTDANIYSRVDFFVKDFAHFGLPNIGDMAAIGLYAKDQHLEDLGKPDRTNFIFCENIGSSQGLVMSTLGKRITKRGGRRYFTTRDGRSVLAGGVHLQGGNKVLWPFFVDATVRKQMSKHSPADFRVARREALRKLVGISLLKTASVVRRLVTIRR